MTESDADGTWEVSDGVRVLVTPSAEWTAARAAIPAPPPSPFLVAQQAWVNTVAEVGADRVLRSAQVGAEFADQAEALATEAAAIPDEAASTFAASVAAVAAVANP